MQDNNNSHQPLRRQSSRRSSSAMRRASCHLTSSNPFYGGCRDNFPSLDRALGTTLSDVVEVVAAPAAINDNNSLMCGGGGGDNFNFAQQQEEQHELLFQIADNVSSSPTESLDLSIDARAALHEHLRHVAKYGVDGEFAARRASAMR